MIQPQQRAFAIAFFLGIVSAAHAAWLDPRSQDLTLKQKMAVIDAGGHLVTTDDVTIVRFRYLLTSLEKSTGLDRNRVADTIATGRDMLRNDYGKSVGLLDLTEAVYRAQALLPGTSLAEIVAATVVTMGTR